MGIICPIPVKSIIGSSEEERTSTRPMIQSIINPLQKGKKEFSGTSAVRLPTEQEIIIKCSIEEMMKAFFKDYMIIWHDPNAKNQENQQYIAQLKRFCEVLIFTEWEKAKYYIKSTQAVCHVITSGTNGELFVKEIFKNENVCNIYVFCGNKEHHSLWAKNFANVSCVETTIQNIVNQIQQNLLKWYKKTSSLNFNLPAFAPIFNDNDKSEMNNLHRYLKIIPNFKNREQAKNDLINLSKTIYKDQKNQEYIADFDKNYNEYNKDHTLRWYTLESFLYKVTNNCLRIATTDSIQYCRLPLQDIERAIRDQYQEKSKSFNGLLYRGAYISEQEWSSLKENKDKEIEMLGFLSVSKVKNVALRFMKKNLNKMALITVIVLKGPNDEEQGFAEIEQYSRYSQEKEILFNVRSRFTVLETEDDYEYSATLKCRHLVLLYGAQGFRRFIIEKNPTHEVLIPSLKSAFCAHCKVPNLEMPEKLFFISLVDPKKDVFYCRKCFNYGAAPFLCLTTQNIFEESYSAKIKGCLLINSSQNQTPFYAYQCCSCQSKKQKSFFICTDCDGKEKRWCENCFDATFECRETGHQIVLETSPFSFWSEKMSENELNHFKFQNSLFEGFGIFQQAQMYFQSHQFEKAIEYYSIYIQENEANGKDAKLGTSYNNIARVYRNQGEYKKALEYYLKGLDVSKSIYGDNHLNTAAVYSYIGIVYDIQGELKKALECHFKSLDIREYFSGEDNLLDIADSLNNVGHVYSNQGEPKKALEYFLKSLDIRRSVYGGDNHPEIAVSYNNIGSIYDIQGEYNKALEYFLKSLDTGKSIYGENHPGIATSYGNIGNVYNKQGEYKKALEYHLKCLDILNSIYGVDNHPAIEKSYSNIGRVYDSQGEYKTALEYHLKSLDIKKSVYGDNHPETIQIQNLVLQLKSIEQNKS